MSQVSRVRKNLKADLKMKAGDVARRVEVLGWDRLATLYVHSSDDDVKAVIRREARRCGYAFRTLLALHALEV